MSIWSSIGGSISRYFSSGTGWSDLLGGIMSGIGQSARNRREDEQAEQGHEWALAIEALRGAENRRTSAFEAELKDYYDQRDKYNKRIALDSYGQFSVMDRRSPGHVAPPLPAAPVKPSVESYNGS